MRKIGLYSFLTVMLTAKSAYAYIGPGIGLGVLGLILGVIVSVIVAVVAVFWYPFALVFEKIFGRKHKKSMTAEDEDSDSEIDHGH